MRVRRSIEHAGRCGWTDWANASAGVVLDRIADMTGDARYVGEFADWYQDWIADPAVDPVAAGLFRVMGEVTGQRVLDQACGEGRIARYLAS